MARFLTANDISFFEKISSELVDDVIDVPGTLAKKSPMK